MTASGQSPSSSGHARRQLRQATFILPRTGQRLKGLLNLRNRNTGRENDDIEAREPLLSEVPGALRDNGLVSQSPTKMQFFWMKVFQIATSDQTKGVLKCSLAYLLASMATFVPMISAFLGHQDGKHTVATIAVYFHPARSQGSMFKAMICAFLAFLYSAFISITSMSVAMFFEDSLGLLPIGHAIVLIIFCGGGFGFIGWTKQRLNDPLVNVACSLASLATITILTREGAVQKGNLSFAKVNQTLKMLLLGIFCSVVVSFSIFPISARKKLRSNLSTTTTTLAVILAHITESFLSGSEDDLKDTEFLNALAKNKKVYGQLDTLLKEAKLEHYVVGTEKQYRLEKRLVRWVQNINQNIGGLRSAATLQFKILAQAEEDSHPLMTSQLPTGQRGSATSTMWSANDETFVLSSIAELPEEEPASRDETSSPVRTHLHDSNDNNEVGSTLSPRAMFGVFIDNLGPSMRSFAYTLKEIFRDIPFGPPPEHKVHCNNRYRNSLERALDMYKAARIEALGSIYRERDSVQITSAAVEADLEEVSASCGHFSFSLMEIGEQLKDLLAILDDLQLESEERPTGRSWNWLKFWRYFRGNSAYRRNSDTENPESRSAGQVDTTVQAFIARNQTTIENAALHRNNKRERLAYRIWRTLRFFRRDDTKFALKVGAGAAVYALPSFLSATRPFYMLWRGEWGLLSYMLVCSMTIGASNTTGYARFLGTCIGAVCALASWYLSSANAYALAFLGWLMSTWTFYINLVKGQGPMGRFIMLTYNLSVLYAYSLTQKDSENDDDEGGTNPMMTEIIVHRVVSVLSGCIWGIVVTRLIWPISARKKFKEGLSLLWLQMSLIWKRDPLSMIATGKMPRPYLNTREKLLIERFFAHLESLQVASRSEFELKSALPEAAHQNMLRGTRNMLNAMYAMNLEVLKNLPVSEGKRSLLRYTASEREQLSARISHLLSVLASSMKIEYPLNDALPNIDHSRDRLLARIYHYRQDKAESSTTTEADYALLYAYVLVTGQLSDEIMKIIREITGIFGVLEEDVIELQ